MITRHFLQLRYNHTVEESVLDRRLTCLLINIDQSTSDEMQFLLHTKTHTYTHVQHTHTTLHTATGTTGAHRRQKTAFSYGKVALIRGFRGKIINHWKQVIRKSYARYNTVPPKQTEMSISVQYYVWHRLLSARSRGHT